MRLVRRDSLRREMLTHLKKSQKKYRGSKSAAADEPLPCSRPRKALRNRQQNERLVRLGLIPVGHAAPVVGAVIIVAMFNSNAN